MKALILILLLVVTVAAQTPRPSSRIIRRAVEPAGCIQGDEYFNTATNQARVCGPNNTWNDMSAGTSSGTVTAVSVVTANGLSGTVATPNTTPAITLNITALDATKIADGTVTSTEFQFINTLSSNVQTQLTAKAPLASPTFTGTVTIPTPFTLGAVSVLPTGTELNFVDGVTSAIQTQLDGKQPLNSNLTVIGGLADPDDDRILFWDDSAGAYVYLTVGSNLSITGTTISATGGGGGGITNSAGNNVLMKSDGTNAVGSLLSDNGTTLSYTGTGGISTTGPGNFATSLTTPSTTFALLNTTATTVNAFGATTALNLGASATMILNFGGSTTASEFRFLEPSGSGTNFTAIKVGAQGASITYILPATVGAAGTFLRDNAGNGQLDWATPSGSGTVTVVGAGSLASTAVVTGGGTTTLQTPSATTTLDGSGNFSTPGSGSFGVGSSERGTIILGEGTAPTAAAADTIQIQAPTNVTTAYDLILPAASTTGFLLNTDASNVGTLSFVGFTGTSTVARSADPVFTGSLQIPHGASPTTDAFGEIAGDNNAQAASRGSLQFFDGTANTYLVGVLASDTCTNGQVPTWNTGGTWTCETPTGGGGSGVQYINALNFSALPDASGAVFLEPYPIKATNDFWKHGHFIFNDTATDDSLYGSFELNTACASGATVTMVWTSTATSGDVRYQLAYRVITADDTSSLDQATAVETITITDTAPGAANRRMSVTFTPTNSNFATAGTVEWKLTRTGTSGSDTMAAAAQLVELKFSCQP